jgi:hypothetical protein
MFRYKLRTLLIVMATLPPVLAGVVRFWPAPARVYDCERGVQGIRWSDAVREAKAAATPTRP